jgi:hypothetical protein
MQFTTTLRTARAGQIASTIGSGGTIVIYTGSAPGVANSPTGTLLCTLTGLTFPSASSGAQTFTATADSSAAASGTPGYGRLKTSGGAAVVEFACAVGSGEGNFNTTVSLGGTVTLSSGTITDGNA